LVKVRLGIVLPPWNIRSCAGDGGKPGAICSGSISGTPAIIRYLCSAGDPFRTWIFMGRRRRRFVLALGIGISFI